MRGGDQANEKIGGDQRRIEFGDLQRYLGLSLLLALFSNELAALSFLLLVAL